VAIFEGQISARRKRSFHVRTEVRNAYAIDREPAGDNGKTPRRRRVGGGAREVLRNGGVGQQDPFVIGWSGQKSRGVQSGWFRENGAILIAQTQCATVEGGDIANDAETDPN